MNRRPTLDHNMVYVPGKNLKLRPFYAHKKGAKSVKSVKPAHLNSMLASDEDPEHTILWPMFFAGHRPGRCSTFTIRRHRIWSSPCMRVLFTVLLLVGAAAAVAAAAALAPALLSCATLAQACARSCCCCSCSSSSSSHVCDKWLGPGRRDWKSPEKAEMTDSNGQNASVPQHSISTKAIALLVGARPTAPCASGALLSPMLSIRELQAPRPGM